MHVFEFLIAAVLLTQGTWVVALALVLTARVPALPWWMPASGVCIGSLAIYCGVVQLRKKLNGEDTDGFRRP